MGGVCVGCDAARRTLTSGHLAWLYPGAPYDTAVLSTQSTKMEVP